MFPDARSRKKLKKEKIRLRKRRKQQSQRSIQMMEMATWNMEHMASPKFESQTLDSPSPVDK